MRLQTIFFDGYTLEWHPISGTATTRYDDGGWSGCPVVEDDFLHAHALGITPQRHRLEHELLHHLVGIHVFGLPSSGVIYRDAHGEPQEEQQAKREEWLVTALTYALHGSMARGSGWRGAGWMWRRY